MRAIVVRETGGPEVLVMRSVDDPSPGPGQVLVAVRAAGVNPVDTYIRGGTHGRKPDLPYTPGMDGAGVVESVGAGVTGVRPGERVFLAGSLTGTYAERALCSREQVHPLPDRVTFSQGAGVFVPYATAWRALFDRASARPAEIVLVHGASGGVGLAAVQIARAAGMTVIGTASTEKGRALVIEQGAHHVLDHSRPDYRDGIAGLTAGRGVDVIVEMLANVNLGHDLTMLAPGGRVVVVGSRGRVEIDARDAMAREASILGMSLLNCSGAGLVPVLAAIGAGLAAGTLAPVVARELPLEEAPEAHRLVMAPGALGKIVLLTRERGS